MHLDFIPPLTLPCVKSPGVAKLQRSQTAACLPELNKHKTTVKCKDKAGQSLLRFN